MKAISTNGHAVNNPTATVKQESESGYYDTFLILEGSFPTSDAGDTTSDASSLTSDAGSLTSDAGSTTSDAGSTTSDAGSITSDAGSATSHAGSASQDRNMKNLSDQIFCLQNPYNSLY